MTYDVKYTSRFKKDYKRLKKRGWNMDKLLDAIDILRSGMEMPPEPTAMCSDAPGELASIRVD